MRHLERAQRVRVPKFFRCLLYPTFAIGFLVSAPAMADDTDGDGWPDAEDNCVEVSNPDQADQVPDGFGNDCDADINQDGFTDDVDRQILEDCTWNWVRWSPECADLDTNDSGFISWSESHSRLQVYDEVSQNRPPGPSGLGNLDEDGWADPFDNCPQTAGSQDDTDGDGLGDVCDPDQVHPNAPQACDEPTIDGVAAWQSFRSANGLPQWTGAVPAPTPDSQAQLTETSDMLLLSGVNTLALFYKPTVANRAGSLIGLTDRRYGAEFIRPDSTTGAFTSWQLCLGEVSTDPESCSPNGVIYQGRQLTSGTWALVTVEGRQTLSLSWADVDGLTVTLEYQLKEGGLQTRPRVEGVSTSGKGIVYLRYAAIPNAGRDLEDGIRAVYARENLGVVCTQAQEDELFCAGNSARYPGLFQAMPWFGYLSGEHGLYVGAHDPRGLYKGVSSTGPDTPANSNWYARVEVYPESSGDVGEELQPSWWTVLRPVCASRGWPALAYQYRKWVLANTEWGAAPLLRDRSDLPQPVRDGLWWFNHSAGPENPVSFLLDDVLKDKALLDPPHKSGHHLYGWHLPGMDRGDPIFEPKATDSCRNEAFVWMRNATCTTDDDCPAWAPICDHLTTEEAFALMRGEPGAQDAYVLPYTNAAHADLSHFVNENEDPEPPCIADYYVPSVHDPLWPLRFLKPDGESTPFGVPWTGTCLVRVNVDAPLWRDTVKANTDAVMALGADGVYLDVIGAAPRGSWDETGLHPKGQGAWATESANRLVAHVKPASGFLASEGFMEQLIPSAPIHMNYRMTRAKMAPLFLSVWSDRSIQVGMRSFGLITQEMADAAGPTIDPTDGDDTTAWTMKMGLATVWGIHPSLANHQTNSNIYPDHAINQAWVNTLMEARAALKDWLAYGEMMGPLRATDIAGASTQITTAHWCDYPVGCKNGTWESHLLTRPAIEAVLYRSEDGVDRIIYVNMSDDSADLYALAPVHLRALDLRMYEIDGTLVGDAPVIGREVKLSAPARTVRYVAGTP